jgi:hypothetical protein
VRKIVSIDPIAVLTHDLGSTSPLQSWPPVPADDLHQGEQLAVHAYGELISGIRSPRHLYATMWRDSDPNAGRERDTAPTGILLSASFGIAPYELTASLVETAEMFNTLDRANLALTFVRRGEGGFRLDSFTLEISDPAKQLRHFRSCWKGEELATADLAVQIDAPATRNGPLRFHLQGRLPRRYNHGARIEDQYVAFTASGGAMPMPDWVNY